MWTEIAQQISHACGQSFEIVDRRPVAGGCINQAYRVSDRRGRRYFLKVNRAGAEAMFAAESLALEQLAATQTIRVPRPLCHGIAGNHSYLVLEFLDLGDRATPESWAQMGRQLAQLHRWSPSDSSEPSAAQQRFGWERDNTLGDTPQINTWRDRWADFWQEQRIGYQLHLAARRGQRFAQGELLLARIPSLLAGHDPQPSLVHGDLWSGNAAVMASGQPTVFDPAVYYGDREVDLAMTELFGRFPAAFYQAYQATWPLAPGFERRKPLYNLYHILNHFNLFGGGYGDQAAQLIRQLL